MHTALVVLTIVAIGFSAFTALVSLTDRPRAVARGAYESLDAVGVPRSWQRFPIGVGKVLAVLGLSAGLFGIPGVGTAAAMGLTVYWSCAAFAHLRARHYDYHLPFTVSWIVISVSILVLDLATWCAP
ncbi:DoxX family protein [Georgenia deserti]|uniref:DoxX family protein n=1 Tax=Georgenia deserti TaxID=2093781 RepID=A0ABW4KXV3_9MICO